jgi:NADH-quinone oxidoreductase subunit F
MDYESVAAIGSQLGSASVIVIDDTVNMAWLVEKTVNFFKHESCGKCTPCREGTYWMNHLARRISSGNADLEEIDLLNTVANQITGKCLCALGEFSTMAVTTGIQKFREDFIASAGKPAGKAAPQPEDHPAAEATRAEVGR